MTLDWKLQRKTPSRMDMKRPSMDTVQSDDLTAIERFTREVIANSCDSKLKNEKKTKITLSLIELSGNQKTVFLEAIKVSSILDAYDEIIKLNDNAIHEHLLGLAPSDLLDPFVPLRILTITDENTHGLIGPENLGPWYFNNGKIDSTCRFIGLCRSTGLTLSGEQSDTTGSWGYGKSVLWANNQTKIVFFFSVLSSNWEGNGVSVFKRLFGYTMLPDFYLNGKLISGDIYCGISNNDDSYDVVSLWNEDAERKRKEFGIDSFNVTKSGTSIMIVGFEPDDDRNYSSIEIVNEIKDAVEKFFWPAISDNEVEVQIFHNGERITSDINKNREIEPFVRLYNRMRRKPDSDEVVSFDVRGPNKFPFEAKILVGVKKYTDPPSDFTLMNSIAKIRGNKMVIQYEEVKLPGLSSQGAIGVTLAGEILNNRGDIVQDQQKKLDEFLLFSEPISHHKWDNKNKKLKKYQGGPTILKINSLIRNEFKKIAIEFRAESESEYSTLLSRIFSFGGSIGPSTRGGDITYRHLIDLDKQQLSGSSQKCIYHHVVVLQLQKRRQWTPVEGRNLPTHFAFEASFVPVDEAGRKCYISELEFEIASVEKTEFNEAMNEISTVTVRVGDSSLRLEAEIPVRNYTEFKVTIVSKPIERALADMYYIKRFYRFEKERRVST